MAIDPLEAFPHTRNFIWLNHAGVSPIPAATAEAMAGFVARTQTIGPWREHYCEALIGEARLACARLVDAKPDEICLTKSTTHGIVILANSIRWREGANVVLLEGDFPANCLPWKNVAKECGLEVRMVPATAEGRYTVESILAHVDSATQLVAAPWVLFSNGFRLDLKKLGAELRLRHVLFSVDAIQGLGAIPMNVRECHIDFLTSGAHKWLLGAEGAGFLFVREGLAERTMNRRMLGWLGTENPEDYGNVDQEYVGAARRFEEGARNMIGLAAMTASLGVLRQARSAGDTLPVTTDKTGTPQDVVFNRILEITTALGEGLLAAGYRVVTPMNGVGERSGIVAFQHKVLSPKRIVDKLSAQKIYAVARMGAVRFSPHFYVTDADLDRIIEALKVVATLGPDAT